MSGHRHTGGVQGTVLLRGVCPVCRREVAGGNCESGDARGTRIMLRQHNNPATGQRCTGSRDRVPTDLDRTAAWAKRTRDAERAREERWRDRLSPPAREPATETSPTGCPLCGSDDYDTETDESGTPDYKNGVKTCQGCGEQWQ